MMEIVLPLLDSLFEESLVETRILLGHSNTGDCGLTRGVQYKYFTSNDRQERFPNGQRGKNYFKKMGLCFARQRPSHVKTCFLSTIFANRMTVTGKKANQRGEVPALAAAVPGVGIGRLDPLCFASPRDGYFSNEKHCGRRWGSSWSRTKKVAAIFLLPHHSFFT